MNIMFERAALFTVLFLAAFGSRAHAASSCVNPPVIYTSSNQLTPINTVGGQHNGNWVVACDTNANWSSGSDWCMNVALAPMNGGCKPLPNDPITSGWCEIKFATTNGSYNGMNLPQFGAGSITNNTSCTGGSTCTQRNIGPTNPFNLNPSVPYKLVFNQPANSATCVARSGAPCGTLGASYDKCDWASNPFAGTVGGPCYCLHSATCPGGVNGLPCWGSSSTSPSPTSDPCNPPTASSIVAQAGASLDCYSSCDGVPLTYDQISTGTGLAPTRLICNQSVSTVGQACSTSCTSNLIYPDGNTAPTGTVCTTPTLSVIMRDSALAFPIPVPSSCASSSPSPSPSFPPFTSTVPFDPMAHRCGVHTGFPSSMPSPRPSGMPSDFNALMNPMAACCWNGWATASDPASRKMDCMERKVTAGEDFLTFYNEGGPRGTPPVPSASPVPEKHAGVLYPNRLFMLNSVGSRPVNGFYNAKGERCGYRNPATGAAATKTAPEQMALFDSALDAGAPPADVQPNCCNLILLGLERKCPDRDPTTGQHWRTGPPESTYTRCTAASEMKVHFGLFDLCNPENKKRARFHGVTSISGIANTDNFPVAPLELDALIKKSFPSAIAGPCPDGFTKTAGKCVIQ